MHRIGLSLVVVLVLLLAMPVVAQELPKAEKRTDANYYSALFLKFKPGMAGKAYEIIYEHFVPVGRKLGRKTIGFDLQTGEWDQIVFFPMEGGPSELEWITSPGSEKWWAAFAEQEGGIEKARELFQKYLDTVAVSKWEVAHVHVESSED